MFWAADPPHWSAEGSLWLIQVAHQMGPWLSGPWSLLFLMAQMWKHQLEVSDVKEPHSLQPISSVRSFLTLHLHSRLFLSTRIIIYRSRGASSASSRVRHQGAETWWREASMGETCLIHANASFMLQFRNLSYVDLLRSRLFSTADRL